MQCKIHIKIRSSCKIARKKFFNIIMKNYWRYVFQLNFIIYFILQLILKKKRRAHSSYVHPRI